MKKVYFLFLLCCVSFVALSQTTVTIYATGAAGSFITGNSTAAARADGNVVATAATKRGYAVFNLSTIPAGATITSCTIGYNIVTVTGGAGGVTYETYGYPGNLSTVTTAATLFPDMTTGSPLTNVTYGAAAGNQTLASTAATTTFLQGQVGNTISICWTMAAGARNYTITGETGTATTTGAHAPYLSITYCAPPTGVTATASPTTLCVGGTITLTGAATGATSYAWAGPAFTSGVQNTSLTATPGSSGVYTLTATNLCGTATATATATTAAVTVNLAPDPIAGGPNVCTSQTASLTDGSTGGTWSSSTTSVATITAAGVVTGVGTGTTLITYTLGTGCTDTMTINDFPVPANITGGASVICNGGTLTLIDGTTGGVWSSSSTPVATVSTTGEVTASSGGTATISYTLPSGCFSDVNVIVNPATAPDPITGATSECVGSNTRLVDPSGGGNWSSSNSGTALVYPTGVVYGISAGTATITFTSAATDCYATSTMTVVATPPAIGGTLSQCSGTTSTLTDGTTGGAWSSSNTGVATIDPVAGVVTGVALGTTIISYIVPPGCPVTAIVTINPLPAAIAGSAVVCTGSTALLTDAYTGGGTWSSSNTSFATIGLTTGVVTGVAAGALTVTFTTNAGCTAVAAINDVDPPNPITGGAVGICVGATVALGETSTGGTWAASNTNAAVSATGVVTGDVAGVDTISYTGASTCSATTVITVEPLPAAIGGNANVCTDVTSTLTDATTGGIWSSSATGTATINSTTGAVTGVLAGTATITYTLGTGCVVTLAITDSDPPAPLTGGSVAFCAGTSVTLVETSTGGTWTTSNTTVSTVDGTGDVYGAGGGTDTVLYTFASGCFAGAPVTVNALPAAIAGGTTVCTGLNLDLTDASTGGTWSSSATGIATVNSTSGVVTGVLAGTATITYTLGTGCTITSVITDSDPPAPITSTTTVICPAGIAVFTETTTGGTWSSSNTAVATVDNLGNVNGVAGGSANISYIMPSGCFVTTAILVNPAPVAIGGATSICTGSTTILDDGTSGGTWSSENTAVATINTGNGEVLGEGAGTTTISYIITATGCYATMTMTDNDPPVAIGGVTVVCVGSSIALTETTTGGTWSSSNTLLATVDGFGNVYGASQGEPTISYIMPTGCFITLGITVNPLPDPIVGATSICTGSTLVLTDGSAPAGTWSSLNLGVASIDPTSGTVTGEGFGTTTISYTLTATGCFVTSSMTDTDPPVAIFGPTVVCQLAVINLSDGTGGGTWVSANVGLATVDAFGNVTGVDSGATTISYILTTTGCFVTSPVTINPIPAAITGSPAVCTALTTVLADVTTGGTWSSSAAGTASVDAASGTVYGMTAGTATISYILTTTSCYVTASMTDNDPPTPIVGTTPICVGATVTFTDAIAEGGTWSSQFPGTALANSLTGDIFGNAPGADTIYYNIEACPAATFAITVNPAPTPITGPTSVCVSDSITLFDATTGGFWGSGFPGVALVSPTGVVTGQNAGTVTINYTIGGCTPASYTIVVNPIPAAIAGLTQVCATYSTLLTDAVPGGSWSSEFTSIASVTSAGPGAGDVLGVSAGATVISYTLPAGCYKTYAFTVNPLPAPITFPTAIVCQGSVITYSEDSTTGAWSSSNTSIASVGTGVGIITGIAAGTANISYTLLTGCFVQTPVTVNPLPFASTGPTMVCIDATIPLVNTSPGGPGSWSSINTLVATVGLGSGVVTGVTVGTTSIVFSLPTGCNTSTTVTVNPLPDAIFGVSSVCVGSAITLTDATPDGDWSSSNTDASVVPSLGVVNGLSAGVTNISYTVTATGCSAVTPVTVYPLPAAITGPVAVCSGSTITLAEGDTGGTWTSADITLATVDPATGIVTGVGAIGGGVNILYTFPSGCSTGFAITTQPTPVATITAVGPLTFCVGGNVSLTAAPTGAVTYQWLNGGVPIPAAIGNPYSASSSGVYAVIVTNSFLCSDTSAADTVSNGIFPLLNDTGAVSICAGNNLALTVTNGGAVGALTYVWQVGGTAIPGAVSNTFDITAPGIYNVLVTVVGASGTCAVTSDNITITVNPLPTPSIGFDGATLSTTATYTSYEWFLNTVGIPGATSSSYVPVADGSYRVLVVDANGCDGYSAAFQIANVGVGQVSGEDVKIYPNPATSVVHIESPVSVRAVVTSIDGKILLNQDNAKELNISSLADGMYLVVIYDESGNQLKLDKLIKE